MTANIRTNSKYAMQLPPKQYDSTLPPTEDSFIMRLDRQEAKRMNAGHNLNVGVT